MNQALGTYQLPAFSIIYGLEYTEGTRGHTTNLSPCRIKIPYRLQP
jgi:hypothetical protein